MLGRVKKVGGSILKSTFTIAIAIGIIGFVLLAIAKNSGITGQAASNLLLAKMPQRSLVSVNTHIANNVIPPTNKWFSSLAFQQPSNPVYAWPLAMKLTETGFVLSQPQITASPNVVMAPFTADITGQLADQVDQSVTGYDDLSVTFNLSSQNVGLLDGRLTRGSPFLYMTLKPRKTIILSSSFKVKTTGSHAATFESDDLRYGLYADSSSSLRSQEQSLRLQAGAKPARVAIFAIAPGADSTEYFKAAANPITLTTVQSNTDHGSIHTTYRIESAGGHDALFGLLPFADRQSGSGGSLGKFTTLEGEQSVRKGKSFSFAGKLTTPDNQLNLGHLSSDERQQLKHLVNGDIANLSFQKDDSYFAGKELYRAAQLLQLARQLGMTQQADQAQAALKSQLNMWFDPNGYKSRTSKYFYYDNDIKGLVASKSSFGSEQFNDHHFHYGYFLDAAAVLGSNDKGFLNSKKDFVNLLAKDIINTDRTDKDFPYLRNFDSYVGHSWASGFADFNDGQNQESSSEAVHAWSSAYQWARVSGNTDLRNMSLAMYARESQAAQTYWLSKPPEAGYQHSIVPLVWSGKLDYATFFNETAEAKLGIQLIPMWPGSNYLNANKSTAPPASLTALNSELGGGEPTVFKDYLLMYEAMFDPKAARAKLSSISQKDVDGANSMSYLYAWVYSR